MQLRSPVVTSIVLLAGSLLAGLGFCALLPPFEGFDETAHYSYIAQVAQTGTWPRVNGPMSSELDGYFKVAPTPMVAPWSYHAFFAASPAVRNAGAEAIHGPRDPTRPWRDSPMTNWEGQQPPVYYTLLAPLWLASKGWSLYAQLFLLRAVSYFFAWSALVIVTISMAREPLGSETSMIAPGLWPALFPMWFPEMARLGNDSLTLLLLALAWIPVCRGLRPGRHVAAFALAGALSGLAIVTKAIALPFAGAVGLFLAWRLWSARRDAVLRSTALLQLLVFGLAILAVSGWWFAYSLAVNGSPYVSESAILLAQKGGLLAGLGKNFSLVKTMIVLAEEVRSFAWSGSWSFIFLPRTLEAPLTLLVLVIAGGWIWQTARNGRLRGDEAIVLLTLGFFAVGIVWEFLIRVALINEFQLGAWYFHVLLPLLAPMVAQGLDEMVLWRRARLLTGALVVYPLPFLLFVTAFYQFYFAGCLPEATGLRRYSLDIIAACAANAREVVGNLAVLGRPSLAMPLFLAGWLAMLVGVGRFVGPRFLNTRSPRRMDKHAALRATK